LLFLNNFDLAKVPRINSGLKTEQYLWPFSNNFATALHGKIVFLTRLCWFIYQVKKHLSETALVFFIFLGDFCIKSSYVVTRRITEAWRTSRALGHARSVVFVHDKVGFQPQNVLFFIFRCVF